MNVLFNVLRAAQLLFKNSFGLASFYVNSFSFSTILIEMTVFWFSFFAHTHQQKEQNNTAVGTEAAFTRQQQEGFCG